MRSVVFLLALALAFAGCQSSDVSRSLGARCDLNADCDETCLGPSGDWPGGFCTTSCDTNADCDDSARCIDEMGRGQCAASCLVDVDCAFLGAGYGCKDIDGHTGGIKVKVCRGG